MSRAQLIDRLQPTLPIILANLVSLGKSRSTISPPSSSCWCWSRRASPSCRASRGQHQHRPSGRLPGLQPQHQLGPLLHDGVPARTSSSAHRRSKMHPTGSRATSTAGCRRTHARRAGRPQHPCITRPGKRAPTVKLCESDEHYVPLNDGDNWKGDPNATLSGQDVPQAPPGPSAQPSFARRPRRPGTTQPPAATWGQMGASTPNPIWRQEHSNGRGRTC